MTHWLTKTLACILWTVFPTLWSSHINWLQHHVFAKHRMGMLVLGSSEAHFPQTPNHCHFDTRAAIEILMPAGASKDVAKAFADIFPTTPSKKQKTLTFKAITSEDCHSYDPQEWGTRMRHNISWGRLIFNNLGCACVCVMQHCEWQFENVCVSET